MEAYYFHAKNCLVINQSRAIKKLIIVLLNELKKLQRDHDTNSLFFRS